MARLSLGKIGFSLIFVTSLSAAFLSSASAEEKGNASESSDENILGELIVSGTVKEHFAKVAILKSNSALYEDVVVRNVVRKDLDLSGMFRLIPDSKAPPGAYGFNDPVDIKAWQALGAEAMVKVAARSAKNGKVEVLGLAYFPSAGKEPVYKTTLVVSKSNVRKTAHQITDDLLGALTGRPGGFSSRFAFSGPWGRNQRVFTADADGHGLAPRSELKSASIGPAFGPHGALYYSRSKNYAPYRIQYRALATDELFHLSLPFKGSVYSLAFDKEKKRLAVAVAENGGSAIYVGDADGSKMERVSKTKLATHPTFAPDGKLAWVGGSPERGSQRIFVDGKAVSPGAFTAAAPTFCDTEDGTFLVYAVGVGGGRQDLVMSSPTGKGLTRLTQNQGSNSYPACSPDGRLLAFFSTRKSEKGLYVLSLKRWTTKKILGRVGESLRWEPLPREELTRETAAPGSPAQSSHTAHQSSGPACGLAPGPT